VKGSLIESKTSPGKPAKCKSSRRDKPARFGRGSKGLVLAARSFSTKIAAFEVINSAGANLAGRWRLEIDAQERKVIEWFAPAKQVAFKAHAAICSQEREALAPYRQARRVINNKLAVWQAAQTERIAAAAGPAGQVASPTETRPAVTDDTESTSRVEGVSFRETWHAEVIDKVAFIVAIAARRELINLVDANPRALAHLARAQRNALDIPGVRVWRELSVAASQTSQLPLD